MLTCVSIKVLSSSSSNNNGELIMLQARICIVPLKEGAVIYLFI